MDYAVLAVLVASVGVAGAWYLLTRPHVVVFDSAKVKSRRLYVGDQVWLRGRLGSMTGPDHWAQGKTCKIHAINKGTVDVWVDERNTDTPSLVAKVYFGVKPDMLSTENLNPEMLESRG